MPLEIERKFSVKNDLWRSSVERSIRIRQAYLNTADAPGTIRVRLCEYDDHAEGFITLKARAAGIMRHEFEYPIPAEDASAMFALMQIGYEVAKVRHHVHYDGKLWEVDEFEGLNAPLIFAEIELEDTEEKFTLPPWVGEDISLRSELTNGALSREPWQLRGGK